MKRKTKKISVVPDIFFFQKQQKNNTNTNTNTPIKILKKLKPNESALRTCPLCTKDFHWTLIDAHASECVGIEDTKEKEKKEEEKKKKKKNQSVSEEGEEEEEENGNEGRETRERLEETIATTKKNNTTNAFTTLIRNQRLSECKKHLVLGFDKGLRTWNVTYEKKSAPSSPFSGATALKEIERGGIKCKTTLTVSIGDSASDECGDESIDNDATTAATLSTYTNHRVSQSVLASALQKNVRRKRVGPAYRVAKAMSRRNDTFIQCVRRLMIISIEDGTLHPDLPFLAWLMIALSKNFVASNLIKEEVCRIAGELAAQEFRDDGNDFDFVVDEKDGEKEDDDVGVVDDVLPPLSAIQEKFGSNSEETHLLTSLIVRAQFGGMEGDVRMLKKFIRVWMRRFETDSLLWLDKIKSNSPPMDAKILKEISAHPFVKFDIPLEAIDFHVSDIIEHCVFDISSEEFQNIRKAVVLASSSFAPYLSDVDDSIDLFRARELARSAMWYCSSGVNEKTSWRRKTKENEETRKRNQLEPIFKSYAKKACAFAMKAIEERFDLYISNNNN